MELHQGVKTRLSVIVPVTNMGGRLQNLKNWISEISPFDIQVILVHDFRDNETSEEMRDLVHNYKKNNNITFVEGQFGSPGAARNIGLSLVENEWVAFWDSDDVPHVKNVMRELSKASSSDLDCIVGNFEVNCANSKKYKIMPLSNSYMDDIGLNPGLWRFVFNSAQLGATSFADLSMAEDQVFLAKYFSILRNVKVSNSTFYIYFTGQKSQLTRNKGAMRDLPIALKMVSDVLMSGKGIEQVTYILFTRIFFTTLKRSCIFCKISAVKTWFSLFIKVDFSAQRNLLRAARLIIWNV